MFFAIGRFFGLAPLGMVKVAAFFATLKLAVAIICAWHVLARLRALISGTADTEIFEAGLILIVLISIALVGPAVWAKNALLVRESAIQLLLAAVGDLALRGGAGPPRRQHRDRRSRHRARRALVHAPARHLNRAYLAFASSAITSAASLKA